MLNTVYVKFADSKYNYCTSVSATATEQSCTRYFVGHCFNVGSYPVENFQKCIGIEFINENTNN